MADIDLDMAGPFCTRTISPGIWLRALNFIRGSFLGFALESQVALFVPSLNRHKPANDGSHNFWRENWREDSRDHGQEPPIKNSQYTWNVSPHQHMRGARFDFGASILVRIARGSRSLACHHAEKNG